MAYVMHACMALTIPHHKAQGPAAADADRTISWVQEALKRSDTKLHLDGVFGGGHLTYWLIPMPTAVESDESSCFRLQRMLRIRAIFLETLNMARCTAFGIVFQQSSIA